MPPKKVLRREMAKFFDLEAKDPDMLDGGDQEEDDQYWRMVEGEYA